MKPVGPNGAKRCPQRPAPLPRPARYHQRGHGSPDNRSQSYVHNRISDGRLNTWKDPISRRVWILKDDLDILIGDNRALEEKGKPKNSNRGPIRNPKSTIRNPKTSTPSAAGNTPNHRPSSAVRPSKNPTARIPGPLRCERARKRRVVRRRASQARRPRPRRSRPPPPNRTRLA